MKMCIVIPAYNEELTIRSVVTDLAVLGLPVFVVDDGSSDKTAELSSKAGAEVISHSRNRGNGAALNTGLTHAFKYGFSDVLTMDADGAHRASDAASAIQVHRDENANLTIGSRFMSEVARSTIPTQKVDANRFAISMFNLIFSSRQTDVASGFRVVDSAAFRTTPIDDTFSWTFGCLGNCIRNGLKVCEAPIGVRYDAQELWATSIKELGDFLDFCSREQPRLASATSEIAIAVSNGIVSALRVSKEVFFLHPVPKSGAVIFQKQNDWHQDTSEKLNLIDIDAIMGIHLKERGDQQWPNTK